MIKPYLLNINPSLRVRLEKVPDETREGDKPEPDLVRFGGDKHWEHSEDRAEVNRVCCICLFGT